MGSTAYIHPFDGIPDAQLESGKALQLQYAADPCPKITLLDGIYRNENGTAFVPRSIVEARERLAKDPSWHHEYPPFLGRPEFLKASEELFLGRDCSSLRSGCIASMQTVGATGACHMAASFLKEHFGPWKGGLKPRIFLPKDSWVNYRNIFRGLDIDCRDLPYYDAKTKSLDFESFKTAVKNLPSHSAVVLQVSAHNPSGCDPTIDQWRELRDIFLQCNHFAFLDSAYLGLVSGDPESDSDVGSIRVFAESRVPMLLAATFGKSFSLYGERVGILSIVAPSEDTQKRMQKRMILLARSKCGASPSFGARIVEIILTDAELRERWKVDLKGVSAELQTRRKSLRDSLERLGAPGDWKFITDQVGMFSYLGLSEAQVDKLRTDHHVYMDKNARVCFGTLYRQTSERIADGIFQVLRELPTPNGVQ